MDPITATIQLVALAVWKVIDGAELVKTAYEGIVSNRADWAFGRIRQGLVSRLQNGQIVNHDIQRAVYEAYLNATLLACHACLRPLETSQGLFATNDAYFSDEAKSLRLIKRYVDEELEKFSDTNYAPTVSLEAANRVELLLPTENITAFNPAQGLARQLKEGLLNEIKLLFDTDTVLTLPDSFRKSILEGWHDGKGPQDWFEWVCGFFHEYLKTRPRLSEILEKQWLAKLTLDTQAVNVQVINVQQSLASLSGQVVEMIALIKQLDGKTDELLEYGKLIPIILDLLRSQSKPQTPARAKYLNTFARYDLQNLIGREKQLLAINEHLANHNLLLLRGMGGIGKTTLARAYLARTVAQFDHVAFLEITSTIADAMLLYLGGSQDVAFSQDPNKSTEENFNALLDVLRHIPNTLLIVDNANDTNELLLRKKAFDSLPWKVLITSRARVHTYQQEQKVQEVKQLMPDEAQALFVKLYAIPLNDAETDLVKNFLEKAFYHPKLIEVLAKAARENPLLELAMLREIVAKKEYDDEEINYPVEIGEAEKPVYRILLDLFNTDQLNEEAQQLLRYFSVLPTIDIPFKHLTELLNAEEASSRKSLSEDLKKLTRSGWLDDLDNRYFSMHGLVQWVVRERLKPTAENCELLISSISNVLKKELDGENSANKQIYLPYITEFSSLFDNQNTKVLATAFLNAGIIYTAIWDNRQALDYTLKALQINTVILPTWHPDLANTYNNLSIILLQIGDYNQALTCGYNALNMYINLLIPNHATYNNIAQLVSKAYSNIGSIYGRAGNRKQQLEYLHKAADILKAVSPSNHPLLGIIYGNIGYAYRELGSYDNYGRAFFYYQQALPIYEESFQPDSTDLATFYDNISGIYEDVAVVDNIEEIVGIKDIKNYKQALLYGLKALSIREKFLPSNHPDLGTSYTNIASLYGSMGDIDMKLTYNRKALIISEETLPSNHPDLATIYNNIGSTYKDLGDDEKSIKFHQKAIAIREAVLTLNHPHLASSYHNIAKRYYHIGDLNNALTYMQKAVKILEVIMKPNHFELMDSKDTLADIEVSIRSKNNQAD